MSDSQTKLIVAVREFIQKEKEFLKLRYHTDPPQSQEGIMEFLVKAVKISAEAFDIKNDIQYEYSQAKAPLRIRDTEVTETLRRIRENETFYSLSYYDTIASQINASLLGGKDARELSGKEFWKFVNEKWDQTTDDYLRYTKTDDIHEDFHSWFDVVGYYVNRFQVGCIITSTYVPEDVVDYFEEIRDAFSFRLFKSCIALCRALLEMTLFNKLIRTPHFAKERSKVDHIQKAKEDNLFSYINRAKRHGILDSARADQAHEIRMDANKILHVHGERVTAREPEALRIIFNTVSLVEYLYK